jgi:hypothetical protein
LSYVAYSASSGSAGLDIARLSSSAGHPRDRKKARVRAKIATSYTRPANDFNDENIFVISSPYDEIKEPGRKPIKVDAARCQALALHVRAEHQRIFALCEKFTPGSS